MNGSASEGYSGMISNMPFQVCGKPSVILI